MSISSVVSLCCHVPLRPCGMTAGLECSSCGRVYNPTADALRASLAAAEAKLADEERHADALATPQACDGSGSVLQPHFTEEGEDAGAEWVQCDGCCACAMAAHAARRAGTTAVEREEGKR